MIEVNNITKSFDDNEVLGGVSANLEKGKVNFIIGRSGSGKSVMTNALSACTRLILEKLYSTAAISPT